MGVGVVQGCLGNGLAQAKGRQVDGGCLADVVLGAVVGECDARNPAAGFHDRGQLCRGHGGVKRGKLGHGGVLCLGQVNLAQGANARG